MSAQPPPGPPRSPAPGPSIGPPGGVFGPPGGVQPPSRSAAPSLPPSTFAAIAPIPSLEPAPGATGATPMAAIPGGGAFGSFAGTAPTIGADPGGGGLMPGGGAPGGGAGLPGVGRPIVLPDLQAIGRAAMADVLEGERAASAARDRVPDLIAVAEEARAEVAAQGRTAWAPPTPVVATAPTGEIGNQTPHTIPSSVAARRIEELRARVHTPRTSVPGGVWAPPPPAGGWRPAPPPRRPARLDTGSWPGAEVVRRSRDPAQRLGDMAYPLLRKLVRHPAGVFTAIALFGLVVPVLIMRQSWGGRSRFGFSVLVFYVWLIAWDNLL